MTYFSSLKEGQETFSTEHGIVSVLMMETRDNVLYATCQTAPESDDEDDVITFDAIEGELRPITWVDRLPHLVHCYASYTLQEAVQMVVNKAQLHFVELNTIEEVKAFLAEDLKHVGFNWITGQHAMELITAYTENRPIEDVAAP